MGGNTQDTNQNDDEFDEIPLNDDQEDLKKLFREFNANISTKPGYTPSKNAASDIYNNLINKTREDVDHFFSVWNNPPH